MKFKKHRLFKKVWKQKPQKTRKNINFSRKARKLISLYFQKAGYGSKAHLNLRLGIIAFVIFVVFAAMVLRLWDLQVLNASNYKALVQENVIRSAVLNPIRGVIYDRGGDVLVGNRPVEEIMLDRSFISKNSPVVANLAALLGLTQKQILQAVNNPYYSIYQPVPIKVGANGEEIAFIKEHPALFPGVTTEVTTVPTYPYGDLLAQTLGYLGPISAQELKQPQFKNYLPTAIIGQSGLEYSYQNYLEGTPGRVEYAVNSYGQVVKQLSEVPPEQGDSLVTSIDLGLEQVLTNALASQMQKDRSTYDPIHGIYPSAPGGAAVVMDIKNGDILALASLPSYNPSVWIGGISGANYQMLTSASSDYPMLNRVIQGLYTPGSVFKLATATAALDDGLISTGYTYDDATGTFSIPNCNGKCVFHDDDSQPMGVIGIPKAIAASDDVFFYNLGYEFFIRQKIYGATPIQNMASNYSFGELTGIDLPGEQAGIVDSLQARLQRSYLAHTWYAGDQIEMAFGQGATLITPIQLAVAYATFANRGVQVRPHIGYEIIGPRGKVVKKIPVVEKSAVSLPDNIYQTLLAGFEGAITKPYGTVGALGIFNGFPISTYPIAGKTGTASIGNNKEPNANFVAFGPADNPKYVVAVMIEQAGYGASAASPVALKVFQYLLSNPIGPVSNHIS